MHFQSCYSNSNPTYYISSLAVTDTPITLVPPPEPVPSSSPTEEPSVDYIWLNDEHNIASGSYASVEELSCFEQKDRLGITSQNDGTYDYFAVSPDKWVSGGVRFGCVHKNSNWQCDSSCYPFDTTKSGPDFSQTKYITFKAKIGGSTTPPDCIPSITLTGGGWPRLGSNKILLEGNYVDTGSLSSEEWHQVHIPLDDMKTAEWLLNDVYGIYFQSCYTNHNPTYHIAELGVTDEDMTLVAAQPLPTVEPTLSPTHVPTHVPSPSPTIQPTSTPITPGPTPVPETTWQIWNDSAQHDAAIGPYTGDETFTCFEQKDRLGITSDNDDGTENYFTVSPDKWVSGGILVGCMHKDSNYNCDSSCFPFDLPTASVFDFSDKSYLTFKAKVGGTPDCTPSISFSGGGWPRLGSNKIPLQDSYIDHGYVNDLEWRNVHIPLDDFKTTEWPDLNNVYSILFQSCYTDNNPVYYISSLAVTTNDDLDLVSSPPSESPTEYVTGDPLLATHRFVYKNWYPILGNDREVSGHYWVESTNNTWPSTTIPSNASPQTVTIHIPPTETVVYSGRDIVHYDKIVIEGSLTIKPTVDGDVHLTASTIVVEEGGELIIETSNDDDATVTIEIDGALNLTTDPSQQMVGIVGLQGDITISGNDLTHNRAVLGETATAGTNSLLLVGSSLDFAIGGEFVLPDTQQGLDVNHYKFPENSNYVDQTEICTITAIQEVILQPTGGTRVTCELSLAYEHTIGFTAGYVTRSITIKTSPQSTDRGHLLHTGYGKFEVRNARIEQFGRSTTELLDSTEMTPTDLKFGEGIAQMNVTKTGTNQIARYALHAHHSRFESYFTGNAILFSPRDGCVAHDSRVHILDNVIVGADGTGIFLEDSTETGPVIDNYIIGTGGGTRGGDDGRFSIQAGKDMAHGGFGIWSRGKLSLVQDNHCEGHFGRAPYGFFVHPNFIGDKVIPDVPGTPPELIGLTGREISELVGGNGLQLQTYGGFVNNTAIGTFPVGLDMLYFGGSDGDEVGSIIEGAKIQSLASSGIGMSTTHTSVMTLEEVTIEGLVDNNSITGIWCNNCNNCNLITPNTTLVIENVETVRGGNC